MFMLITWINCLATRLLLLRYWYWLYKSVEVILQRSSSAIGVMCFPRRTAVLSHNKQRRLDVVTECHTTYAYSLQVLCFERERKENRVSNQEYFQDVVVVLYIVKTIYNDWIVFVRI